MTQPGWNPGCPVCNPPVHFETEAELAEHIRDEHHTPSRNMDTEDFEGRRG